VADLVPRRDDSRWCPGLTPCFQGRCQHGVSNIGKGSKGGGVTSSEFVDTQQWWELIEAARQVPDPSDGRTVAARAVTLLSARPHEDILAADRVLWGLLADSYRAPLWAAAYVINGGCSDDGFEYFRGWLVLQGRDVYERIVADPEALADLPIIRARASSGWWPMECEDTLYIAPKAYRAATGEELPAARSRSDTRSLDPEWGFDFDDRAEMTRRLPRLAALFLD
jgi:hypothetical protein